MVTIKSKREIELMKEVCKVVAKVYQELEQKIKVGMSTWELDQIAENKMRSLGAIPAEKGYNIGIKGVPPFPASLCVSINDEVIHGIPSKNRIIKDGDVVSIDTVALKNGYNGDAARTFIVGKASKEAENLVAVTKQAFFEGIKYAKPGNRLRRYMPCYWRICTFTRIFCCKRISRSWYWKRNARRPRNSKLWKSRKRN